MPHEDASRSEWASERGVSATAASGIKGLDAVLCGGFPPGRTTIIVGEPGSGKTVLAMQYLVNGAASFGEPGLMVSFEESPDALKRNYPAASWPLADVLGSGVQLLDGRLSEDAIEAGEFDLSGLISIASSIIAKQGIKRIAIDGLDALFAISENPSIRRREIIRLIHWLTGANLTALLTVKADEGDQRLPPRFDVVEYAADAVIRLKTTLIGELSRRTLSVLKLRGAPFIGGAHPYNISHFGIRVLNTPTRTNIVVQSPEARLSTGVERLDRMLLGGYRQGTTVLLSGLPGTSKTTLGMAFLKAGTCIGERALFIGFDEPANQVTLDAHSVGLNVEEDVRAGLFVSESFAAGSVIADDHYLAIERLVDIHKPIRVVIDPISALAKAGGSDLADAMTERLVVLMKSRNITAIFTAVASTPAGELESTPTRVSTIADTWIHLSFANRGGERNRTLTIVKSRGTAHSNQTRELLLSSDGIDLADVYSSGGDVLVGTARVEREQSDAASRVSEALAFEQERTSLDREGEELMRTLRDAQRRLDELEEHRADLARRTAASGPAHEREIDLIHTLRHGDAVL
jgi:circadian clock protein KaiC